MRLIITRHGETIENKKGIIQGHLPGKLSRLGKEQAKRLAKRLKDEKIDFIYSSDLARAADTAREIVKFHKKVSVRFTKELREKDFGELQGKRKDKIKKYIIAKEKNGETIEQLYSRARIFLKKIFHKHKDKTVLLVGHNGIDKALICALSNKPSKEIKNIENLKHTSISIFEMEEQNHKISLFNCIKHLA